MRIRTFPSDSEYFLRKGLTGQITLNRFNKLVFMRIEFARSAGSPDEAYRDLMTLIPYTRIGEPDDIVQAAVWPASDASDCVTGVTLFVDGGMRLYSGFATGG